MAAPIGVGDWVECVKAGVHEIGRSAQVGSIYRVLAIDHGSADSGCAFDDCDDPGLILEGALGWAGCCHCPSRFRPVYRPNADFIESLKAPPKSAPRQPASPTRTPEVVGASSRDEQNLPAHGVGAGV